MPRALLPVAAAALWLGCSPELGDAPFSCGAAEACPEGYACQSTVCVREGADVGPARPRRATWINAAEMYWMERPDGGAALVVNDGFTGGAHGFFEIAVSPDGLAEPPRKLLGYGDEFPVASSVVALDDGRYGIATLRFPDVDADEMTLEIVAVARQASGASAGVEILYRELEPFLGGIEPAYIGAVAGKGAIDVAWTRPSGGGRVEVLRIERQGSVWTRTRAASQPLPEGILPLSGDCALWRSGDGELTVRVGFESFAVAKVDAAGELSPFTVAAGVPLHAFGDDLLLLQYGDYSASTSSYAVRYTLAGPGGGELGSTGGVLQEGTEPYTATPHQDGALFAPLSDDPSFPAIEVGAWSASAGFARVASVARTSQNGLYSARAAVIGGAAYVAWTEFHESSMDLWVGVADLAAARASSRSSRALSWDVTALRPAILGRRPARLGREPRP